MVTRRTARASTNLRKRGIWENPLPLDLAQRKPGRRPKVRYTRDRFKYDASVGGPSPADVLHLNLVRAAIEANPRISRTQLLEALSRNEKGFSKDRLDHLLGWLRAYFPETEAKRTKVHPAGNYRPRGIIAARKQGVRKAFFAGADPLAVRPAIPALDREALSQVMIRLRERGDLPEVSKRVPGRSQRPQVIQRVRTRLAVRFFLGEADISTASLQKFLGRQGHTVTYADAENLRSVLRHQLRKTLLVKKAPGSVGRRRALERMDVRKDLEVLEKDVAVLGQKWGIRRRSEAIPSILQLARTLGVIK